MKEKIITAKFFLRQAINLNIRHYSGILESQNFCPFLRLYAKEKKENRSIRKKNYE